MSKRLNVGCVDIIKRNVKQESLFGVFTSVVAVVFALAVGGVIISLAGVNPVIAYWHLFYGAFGTTTNIFDTLLRTTPLLLAGIGLAISFRCNLISIGAEGQMVVGGVFATSVGLAMVGYPPVLVILLSMIAGFVGGGLYGFIPGILKAKFGTSEIINTIMLNYIAIHMLSFLLDGPLRDPGSYFPQSALLERAIWFPRFFGSRLHVGFLLGLLAIVVYYVLMFKLPLGYKIRAVGYNPKAAEYAGISVTKGIVIAMVLSGGFAGIAGVSEVFGVHHRLYNEFSAGLGFDALAVALLGQLHPLGVFMAALFFGALRVGTLAMQRAIQIPIAMVYVIQGISILFILMDKFFQYYLVTVRKKRKLLKEEE